MSLVRVSDNTNQLARRGIDTAMSYQFLMRLLLIDALVFTKTGSFSSGY